MNDGHGGFLSSVRVGSEATGPVAIADINNDGYPDVVACLTTSAQTWAVNVYLNQAGTGAFKTSQSIPLPANAGCVAVTTGDMNGDGLTDVVVGGSDSSGAQQGFVFTFFNSSTGKLSAPVQQAVSVQDQQETFLTCQLTDLAAADYSGTGRYDLVLYGFCFVDAPGSLTLYYAQNSGGGHYALSETFEMAGPPFSLITPLRLVNSNNDLLPDLLFPVTGFFRPGFGETAMLATGQGSGKFTVQSVFDDSDPGDCGNRLGGSDMADFNGDGNPDIVNSATVPLNACGSSVLPGYVLQTGNGKGAWSISQQNDLPTSASNLNQDVIAADFNNDNRPDFALVDMANTDPPTFELLVYTNISDFPVNPCVASGPGAHLCTPVAGPSNTERITAAATGITGPVRLMQLFIDGRKVGQFPGNQVNTAITVASGTHTAQVVELEYNGRFSKSATSSFTVKSSACAAPTTAGVKICSPGAGASATSPVPITAAAKAATGTSIKAMRVYVDNVAKFTVNGATLSTSLSMAAGNHSIAVVGFEANGAALKTTETITVH